MFLKKYYCPQCGSLKSRLQLRVMFDSRTEYYQCSLCACKEIYLTADLIEQAFKEPVKHLRGRFGNRHGSFF